MQLFVVTTHYPYGIWHEAFFRAELETLTELCEKVILLPLKELPNRRSVPDEVELLPPLIGINRWPFFLKQLFKCQTWRLLMNAITDARSQGRLSLKALPNIIKFACYRAGIASHERFKQFVGEPNGRLVYGYWAHFPALAALEAHEQGIATCVRYHSGDLYEDLLPESGHVLPWRAELRRKVDLHLFVSDHGLSYFRGLPYTPEPDRAEVHRLGCTDFGPPRLRKTQDASRMLIVSVSSITPVKRVHLIAAFAQALAKHTDVVWHHFGSGDDRNAHQAINTPASGLSVVMHGAVPNDKIQEFFRDNDISFFLNMSLAEGVPVSIMEAINADIKVIATAVGGTPEIVLSGRSGLLIECDECLDSDKLALRVMREMQPGGLLEISRPRDVWEESWNGRVNAARLFDAMRSLTQAAR
jgi:glycosyltransferase involved in cell wall biosynthesis